MAETFFFSLNHANQANLTNVLLGILLDSRAGGPGQVASTSVLSESAGGAVDLGFGVHRINVAAIQSFQLINNENQEYTLLPGDTLRIRQLGLNSTDLLNLVWRERTIEESELRQ